MTQFVSGPPGGRTLPLSHTKLSDLEGGVYGPGASVASTGIHANRLSITCPQHINTYENPGTSSRRPMLEQQAKLGRMFWIITR